jgi:hypothetical protein
LLRERFIPRCWWLVGVVGFVFVGHGWNCFEWIGVVQEAAIMFIRRQVMGLNRWKKLL